MLRIAAFALLAFAAPAFAQVEPIAPPPSLDLTGEIGLVSDFRFRGVSRSGEDPAGMLSLTAGHESGLYAGIRGATIDGTDPFRARDPAFAGLGDVQLDLYAGYGAELGSGFELDAGLLYYLFVGGAGETDYIEPYASLSWLIGPVEATAGARLAPSQRAIGDEAMLYLFGEVGVDVPGRPWRLTAGLGHQDWGRFGSYWTWNAGVAHRLNLGELPPLELGLRYVDTDLPDAPGQDGGLILSAKLVF